MERDEHPVWKGAVDEKERQQERGVWHLVQAERFSLGQRAPLGDVIGPDLASSHNASTACGACETSRPVQPFFLKLSMRSQHFFWNARSPTASTSSINSTSGSMWDATAKASRTCMPVL